MDFYSIRQRSTKNGIIEIYPDFRVCRSEDLMVRGKSFYAIWDNEVGLWSTDEYQVQVIVDKDLLAHKARIEPKADGVVNVKLMSDFSTNSWTKYRTYLNSLSDSYHQLDVDLTFADTKVKKKDYVSRRLPYSIEEGSCEAYEELMTTLYLPEERAKLEWAIGSILAGDGKDIQKFIVLYGDPGGGKSTLLNIIQKLFDGYYTTFEAKALTSSSNTFSTEVFKNNPLVAIQHDGDLSTIEDNSKLNSIVSHEYMTMNEKYKPSYTAKLNCFLFMATNKPVKISDAKSGVIRRLIDVTTSGKRLSTKKYLAMMSQIDFELGAIAHHCLAVYRSMGKNYYASYTPLGMIFKTDIFFNFVEDQFYDFKEADGVSLTQAYAKYKTYCDDSNLAYRLPRHKFREELKNYFETFLEITRINGKQVRSYYKGFLTSKFSVSILGEKKEDVPSISLDLSESLLDDVLSDCPAQYATKDGIPQNKWHLVKTKLSDLDTKKLHYVQAPKNHIVIDFDLVDDNGEKSLERNLDAASLWPPTYAEFSRSRKGIHLHYIYDGDTDKLSPVYSDGIEIKVRRGENSLRRQLSRCNNIEIATIKSGLPLKESKKMINFDTVKSERGLRRLIERNLNKDIHPGTKPSVDFIFTILDDAYNSNLEYDITDLRPKVLAFANNSTNHATYCVKLVSKMKFRSEHEELGVKEETDDPLVFFDTEVFPNLFVVSWKYEGDSDCVSMVNPSARDIEELLNMKLVGYNCRRYDNHILYARYLGYSIEELFELSQKMIRGSKNAMIREAYKISYADVYEFSSVKKSLKMFQIDLGIHHLELGLPWEEPVPEDKWPTVVEYCENDVISLEKVFESRKEDFIAKQILSELSGLSVNDTIQSHTARIIFGRDPNPQSQFVYTDLSEMFPGYTFDAGISSYRGENPSEGGYVYAEPGIYTDVALLDIASMHPTSIELLDLFGPYTNNFSQIKAARLAIKHRNYDAARSMLGGMLEKYLVSEEESEALSYALKIIINIVYGLTSAKFDNKFKDPRNKDNIVAKRGALFMIDLKLAVQDKGFVVAHVKTDSIKIPNATPEIVEFVVEFGKKYGYTFEHETTYERFCLVNDAVYIARHNGEWTATGAQFAHPYVFKTLFSKEQVTFNDLCETKGVSTALYLDMNEDLSEDEHDYHFIGKAGSFCPIRPGKGGGLLLRKKNDKYYFASNTKNWRWLESETIRLLQKEDDIDMNYYATLADKAISKISEFGDFNTFIS